MVKKSEPGIKDKHLTPRQPSHWHCQYLCVLSFSFLVWLWSSSQVWGAHRKLLVSGNYPSDSWPSSKTEKTHSLTVTLCCLHVSTPPPSILYTPTGGNQGPFTAVPRAYSWWGRASESELRSVTNSQLIMSSGQLELLSPTDRDSWTKGKDARHLSVNNTHTHVRKQPAQTSLSLSNSQTFNILSRNPSLSNDSLSGSIKWCYFFKSVYSENTLNMIFIHLLEHFLYDQYLVFKCISVFKSILI